MMRTNIYEEDVEMEFAGEVNLYEVEYMKEFKDYIVENNEEELVKKLIRY